MKYVAFFDKEEFARERRSIDLAGSNVVEFTAEILSRIDNVEIISPIRTLHNNGFYKGRCFKLNEKINVKVPPTFGVKSKFGRYISLLYIQLWLFFTLLINLKKNERMVVYHSLSIMYVIKLLKLIKRFNLTLEVREIYSDVLHLNKKARRKELEYLNLADDYIFPTTLLNQSVNKNSKPFVIAAGIYRDEDRLVPKYNDGKIHLVYAGTLDRLKSGALRSVSVANFLTDKYVIHILGKGVPETLRDLEKEISTISQNTKCKIQYDGELRGDEFKKYIQKCHIGLALQDLSGKYNTTSFPSKILTYLANGLEVVSPRILAITSSPVGNKLHYYDTDSPKSIANTIMDISVNGFSKSNHLNILADHLEVDLKQMFYGK